jgi:nickel-dependent lactate racemase
VDGACSHRAVSRPNFQHRIKLRCTISAISDSSISFGILIANLLDMRSAANVASSDTRSFDLSLGSSLLTLMLPKHVEILSMSPVKPLPDPFGAIERALNDSIHSPALSRLVSAKLNAKPSAKAVVVISDHTRPVPYKGESGILWPVVKRLLGGGIKKENILILVATGTHHPLSQKQLRSILDDRIFDLGIPIKNHDCQNREGLSLLGRSSAGEEILINRHYVDADIRILTGLVESHFIAGVSGGRKSICPGLVGEEFTHCFHSAQMLASVEARDLSLEGNPCHRQALEVARKAGADYIVNVTLDQQYRLTGVFAGDLEKAHLKAYEFLKSYATIKVDKEYDVVITHGGYVGINHYQGVKAGLAALPAIRKGGTLIVAVAATDSDPVGSERYRTLVHLLKLIGPERFLTLISSPGWVFIPEQWEVQAWAKILAKVPPGNLIYYSPHMSRRDFERIPGVDGNRYLPDASRYSPELQNIALFVEGALRDISARLGKGAAEPRVALLLDGPYGIVSREDRHGGQRVLPSREPAEPDALLGQQPDTG